MENKTDKITIKSVWNYFRSEKGKRNSFFLFYLIFFIFLFILLATTNEYQKPVDEPDQKEEEVFPFGFNFIKDDDYSFSYQIISNLEEIEYLGVKEDDILTLSGNTGNHIYKYQEGNLINPTNKLGVDHDEFLDFYLLKMILKSATLDYKTEFSEGNKLYHYEISNLILANFLSAKIVNNNQDIVTIDIYTNKDGKVNFIEIDLFPLVSILEKNDLEKLTKYQIIFDYEIGDSHE